MQRSSVIAELTQANAAWLKRADAMDVDVIVKDMDAVIVQGILPIRTIMHIDKSGAKHIIINGAGFRYLRRKYAHLKAAHRDTTPVPLIPLTTYSGGDTEPTHERLKKQPYHLWAPVGWSYDHPNDTKKVWAFCQAVRDINKKYENETIIDTPALENSTHGVIGVDIPFDEPSWIRRYAIGKAKYNPYFTVQGTYYFGETNLSTRRVSRAVKRLKSIDENTWKMLHAPMTLTSSANVKRLAALNGEFVCNVVFNEHARTLVKNPNVPGEFWLIDPWKRADDVENEKDFQDIRKRFAKHKLTIIPQNTNSDQSNEGSCVIISFARALWIAHNGFGVALRHPIPFEYAVLALRMLRSHNKIVIKAPADLDDEAMDDEDDDDEYFKMKLKEQKKRGKRDTNKKQFGPVMIDDDDALNDDMRIDKKKKKVVKVKHVVKPLSIPDGTIMAKKVNVTRSTSPAHQGFDATTSHACMKYANGNALLAHQRRVVQFMMDTQQRGIILFHSLGSGKSITSIAIARCLADMAKDNIRVVVATPSSVQKQFEREIVRLQIPNIRYEVVTHHHLAKHPDIIDSKTIMIVDEAHNFRNSEGKITQGALEAAARAYKVILASATPVVNDVTDYAVLLAMVHGSRDPTPYAERLSLDHKFKRTRDLLKCRVSYYRTPMDLRNFPSVTERFKTFVMDEAYYKAYLKIQRNELGDTDGVDTRPAFQMHIRRASNKIADIPNAKIDWTVKKIVEDVAQGRKVAVFSAFLSNGVKILMDRLKDLGVPFVALDGAMTPTARMKAVKSYNEGETKVFLFTMAGAEGIDLKATRTMIVMDPWWNTSKTSQIVGRVARFKSHISLPRHERHVDIYYLVLKKPKERDPSDAMQLSADEILYRMAEAKNNEILSFYGTLQEVASEKCKNTGKGRHSI